MAEERRGDALSPRARDIQRRIQEGRYEIDLDGLAERLAGELDGEGELDRAEPPSDARSADADGEPSDER